MKSDCKCQVKTLLAWNVNLEISMNPDGSRNVDWLKTSNRIPGAGYSVPRPLTRIKTISHLLVNKGVILLRNERAASCLWFCQAKEKKLSCLNRAIPKTLDGWWMPRICVENRKIRGYGEICKVSWKNFIQKTRSAPWILLNLFHVWLGWMPFLQLW